MTREQAIVDVCARPSVTPILVCIQAVRPSILLQSTRMEFTIGSVWYTDQVNVAAGFITHFTFRMGPSATSFTTADGMAFVIQNSGVNAIGTSTGQPGYDGIVDSIAVELDTFQNFQISDPNNNHMRIQSCGTAANSFDHGGPCNLGLQANLPITLTDGMPHQAVISYEPAHGSVTGTFTVAVDGTQVLDSEINLNSLLALNGGNAWVGFTSGTGEYWERPVVLNWSFASAGISPTNGIR